MAIEGHREDLISENHGTPLSTRRIPPELFRPIIEHLEHRPTLLALSVTSRILRADAERQLYSVLDDGSDVPQHIAFLSTINQNPRLAGLVQVYHSINIVHYKENPLWDLLYSGLRKMTNLKVFHFRAFGGHPAAELLLDSPFQLEGLHWANHSEGEIMSQFLVQQHSLRHLYLESKRGRTYSSACCPNLTSLGGNRITLESFLPGRRITEISN
ncbi:hypothetical protein BDZ97DRAFT_359189 [Flammula alnicola]|nr:hypothetical protein BDZ97DRAFT_359189 [Flammula alnicola]